MIQRPKHAVVERVGTTAVFSWADADGYCGALGDFRVRSLSPSGSLSGLASPRISASEIVSGSGFPLVSRRRAEAPAETTADKARRMNPAPLKDVLPPYLSDRE